MTWRSKGSDTPSRSVLLSGHRRCLLDKRSLSLEQSSGGYTMWTSWGGTTHLCAASPAATQSPLAPFPHGFRDKQSDNNHLTHPGRAILSRCICCRQILSGSPRSFSLGMHSRQSTSPAHRLFLLSNHPCALRCRVTPVACCLSPRIRPPKAVTKHLVSRVSARLWTAA